MTNKERLKKAMNEDFNKDNNYQELMQKITKEKKNLGKYILVPICLVMLIGGVLFIHFKDKNIILENYYDKENNINLNINNLKEMGIAKLDADIKEIPLKDVYFTWLDILNNMKLPNDLDKSQAYAIYTRKDKISEYDILNCYVYNYFQENSDKRIRIALSNTNKPIRDYHFDDNNSKETIINGIKLYIYKYNNIYFTEFSYKDYNFDIETTYINEQELIGLLVSIIK